MSAPRLTRRKVFTSIFPPEKSGDRLFPVSRSSARCGHTRVSDPSATRRQREELRMQIGRVQRDAGDAAARGPSRDPLEETRCGGAAAIAGAASSRALTREIKRVSRETTKARGGDSFARQRGLLCSCDRSCATNAARTTRTTSWERS